MRSPWRRSLPTGPGPPAKAPAHSQTKGGPNPTSNIQTISELCGICEALVHIVEEQRKALAQHDALVLEDEIAKTRSRYTALLGAEEWPDDCQQQEE